MLKSLALIIFMLFMPHSVQAQVYKCENDAGEVKFSDEPCSKGEASSRLNWLNNAASPKKKKKSTSAKALSASKKTAEKARKNNEAYVLLSLLTTTRLELETASLRSAYEGESTQAPELILPDGVTVDLLKVNYISLTSQYGKEGIKVRFVMDDGYEEIKILKKPYPVISGEAKIGRFKKSLQDIKRIEFFNSQKLLKARTDKAGGKRLASKEPSADKEPSANKKASASKQNSAKKMPLVDKTPLTAEESAQNVSNDLPVIELDLSDQEADEKKSTRQISAKPQIRVVENKKQIKTEAKAAGVQVYFVNDKNIILQKNTLTSSKGRQKSRVQSFIVNEKNQIPYHEIKQIKIRPTANKSSLIVAIELHTKEIKMEVMFPPFTRVHGRSQSGKFNHSLLEIKSISFQ